MYKILLGEEDIPYTAANRFYRENTYTDKVYGKAVDDMIKDKTR